MEIEYLGHVFFGNDVAMDIQKVLTVKDWTQPTNIKQLWGFLGLIGYYLSRIMLWSLPLNKIS